MSHEAAPEPQSAIPAPIARVSGPVSGSAPTPAVAPAHTPTGPVHTGSAHTPKGLIEQMEQLLAALNADLSRFDAELQSSADRSPADGGGHPA
ncbi:hypothetical protein LRS74_07865 [Streptomyces sp. LX-29]|uniref:hypothetical protein n=1 Tax=Streptomyces sp. LX-29 TaxID=2900152 RepID=UPI00240E3E6A|nr:hypothetical protein [Streptomyces sp. LX-29]WFB11975.1 hypothetical protein LRS74_07865 [Streptomyces sp. LX-29]